MSDQSNNQRTTGRRDSRSPIIPKYYQVELALRQRVQGLDPGASLPSEPELAKHYGVSRSTVRTAIDQLVSIGLLYRIQGRGTYVGDGDITFPLAYHTRDDAHPQADETQAHKVISQEVCAAGHVWSKAFDIPADNEVFIVERVAVERGLAMSFDTLAVPIQTVPGIEKADWATGRFFYTLIDFGAPIVRYRMTIESVIIGGVLANSLDVRSGLPGISLTRHGLDHEGRVVAYVRIVTRGDLARYTFEFDHPEGATNVPTKRETRR